MNKVLTAEQIVEENFKGLDELIEDKDLLLWYKDLIVTCMEGYKNQSEERAIAFAEWMVKRGVTPIGGGLWEDYGKDIGGGVGVAPVRKTKEFYQIFLSSMQKNQERRP